MELTIKKDFDFRTNTLQHEIILDALELMKEQNNFTIQGITSVLYLALLHNACEEDIVEIVGKKQKETGSWLVYLEIVEPEALKIINSYDNGESIFQSMVNNIYAYKEREISINGKFFYAAQELIKQLSSIDTEKIADIITSATSLKKAASAEVKAVESENVKKEINDKIQNLITKFQTTKE